MRILWHNVYALILAILVVVLIVKFHHELGSIFAAMKYIGPGYTPEEQTLGLIVFGIILISILALAKILSHGNRKD